MFEHIKYKESTLSNGLKVITAENNSIPIVNVEVWTRTGYRYEKPDELGYAHLLEHMLFKGTKRRLTARDLNLEVDRRGGYFNAFTNSESVHYVLEMMSKDAEDMCDILSDILFNSLLKQETLDNEKKIVLQELKQNQENHERYLSRITQKKIFPGHPLSNNILDTEETTENAISKSLRNYLSNHYRPDQSALVMTGDISHKRAIELANKYFGAWQKPSKEFDLSLKQLIKAQDNYYFEKRDIKQTFLSLNYYTFTSDNLQKSAVLSLISNYLTRGMASVLFQELRDKRGLVYGVSSYSDTHKDAGIFVICASTQKPKEVISVIEQTIADIPNILTKEAFEIVKEQSIGIFTRYIVKPSNQSGSLGNDFIYYNRSISPEEWIGYLESAKHEDVIAVAKEYLRPDNSVLVALGPEDIGR